MLGAEAPGPTELVGLWDGSRASEQAWTERLRALQSHGRAQAPALAIGEGALGCWKALRQGDGQTRGQRCGGQQTANV